VLPRLKYCDSSDNNVAKLVKDNLDITLIDGATAMTTDTAVADMKFMKDGYKKLKEEVEKTYPCLGITCAEVGVYQKSGSNLGDMTVCTDPSPPSVSDLVAAGAAADTYANPASFKAIAGYIPSSDVVAHNKVDLDMQEINNAVGDALFEDALFVYENGGGGKNSDGTAIGNSLKSSGIRYLMGFADNTKMGAEKWYNVYKNYWKSTGMTDVQAAKYSDTNVRPAFEGTGAFSGARSRTRCGQKSPRRALHTRWSGCTCCTSTRTRSWTACWGISH